MPFTLLTEKFTAPPGGSNSVPTTEPPAVDSANDRVPGAAAVALEDGTLGIKLISVGSGVALGTNAVAVISPSPSGATEAPGVGVKIRIVCVPGAAVTKSNVTSCDVNGVDVGGCPTGTSVVTGVDTVTAIAFAVSIRETAVSVSSGRSPSGTKPLVKVAVGCGVLVLVGVSVAVGEGVKVLVGSGVMLAGAIVGKGVGLGSGVGVSVGVSDGVGVGVSVSVGTSVFVKVGV